MIQKSYNNTPTLYLIPTPVGNMGDITLRAIETLKSVEVIFCEDTRITSELLRKLEIKKRLIHSDDHNENITKEKALKFLQDGYSIGLVTDRGTPIISDPGYKIVEYVTNNNFNVVSLPGATAFVPALTMSAINPSPFLFYGFLNSKVSKRELELSSLQTLRYTLIFYEAPHRLKSFLNSLYNVFGNRKIAICREISKKYEEVIRGSVKDILESNIEPKGEYVIIVEGNKELLDFSSLSIKEHVDLYVKDNMTINEAMKKVAKERNTSKSEIYKIYHEI